MTTPTPACVCGFNWFTIQPGTYSLIIISDDLKRGLKLTIEEYDTSLFKDRR